MKAITNNLVKRKQIDFLKEHANSKGVIVESNALEQGLHFETVANFEQFIEDMPVQFYYIDGDKYAYFASGKVRKLGWGSYLWESVNTYDNAPIIKKMLLDGKIKTLVAYDKQAEIVGEGKITMTSSLTVDCITCNNVMFSAKDNQIFFSEPFDPLGIGFDLKTSNVIILEQSLGNVLGLHPQDKKVIAVCEKGLVVISVGGVKEDYVVKRIDDVALDVVSGSVVGFGTSVCFVSNNKVYIFDSNNLKSFDLPKKNMSNQGNSAIYEKYYLYPIVFIPDYRMLTLAVDLTNGKIQYIDWVIGLSRNGGMASKNNGDLLLLKSVQTEVPALCQYSSCDIDMNSSSRKRILGVQAKSKGKITINLHGEFGTKKVYVDGLTDYKCNLVSDKITFDFSAEDNALPLENLRFIYQEKEN